MKRSLLPESALSWWKQLDKPLFSTRTLLKTVNPVWEETAFILVPADAIELGEKLVCQGVALRTQMCPLLLDLNLRRALYTPFSLR